MNRINTKLAKFNTLSGRQRCLLLTALVWLPLFWLGLHLLGLRRFQIWLRRDNAPTDSAVSQDEIFDLARLVNIAARQPFIPATCLTRSLLLNWMLQQRGIASQLRIGVRLSQGKLDAHAWVEYQGIPINDQADVADHFAPFAEILPAKVFPSS